MSDSIAIMCYTDVGHNESVIKNINKLKGFAPWTNML